MFTFRHIKAHLAFYLQLYGNRVLEKGFIGLVVGFFVFLFSLRCVFMSQKNDTDVAHYNFQRTLTNFGNFSQRYC